MDLILAIILGLIIGSYLNVCIYRIPLGLSVTNPKRSFCPKCENQLTWLENIPVISWLIQGGKCKNCKEKIPGRYPLVELLSGLAAAASVIYFEGPITQAMIYALTATLIVITFIDFDHKIIPNKISFPGIIIGCILGIVAEYTVFHPQPFTQSAADTLIGILAGGGFFYVIGEGYYLVTKREGLGGGDVKLMAMTGAILGWDSVAPTIFVGSIVGAVAGISIMIFTRSNHRLEIPFGPWLSLGVIIYLFGDLPYFRF